MQSYEDIFKVAHTKEGETHKWKKIKVLFCGDHIILADKGGVLQYKLKSITAVLYPNHNLVSIEDNLTKKEIFIQLGKKYDQWSIMLKSRVNTFKVADEQEHKDVSRVLSSWLSRSFYANSTMTLKKDVNNLSPISTKVRRIHSFEKGVSPTKIPNFFGASIQKIYEKSNNNFPGVIQALLMEVEQNGLNTPGIYRESGEGTFVQILTDSIEEGAFDKSSKQEIHVVTGVIKLFFRKLQEKIIPTTILESFGGIKIKADRLNGLITLIEKLPFPNRSVLYRLMEHFQKINDCASINLMDYYNISVVFGPTLVDCDPMEMLNAVDMLHLLISNRQQIISNTGFMKDLKINSLTVYPKTEYLRYDIGNFSATIGRRKSSCASSPTIPDFKIHPPEVSSYEEKPQTDFNPKLISPRNVLKSLKGSSSDENVRRRFKIVSGPASQFKLVLDTEENDHD